MRVTSNPARHSLRYDPGFAAAFGVSTAASLVYVVGVRMDSLPLDVLAKGLSAGALGIFALLRRRTLLAAALLLSSLGDVLLDAGTGFVPGLTTFLCAHLVYIALFLRHRREAKSRSGRPWFGACVLVYASGMAVWLAPHAGSLRLPVFAYLVAITVMVIAAGRAGYNGPWVVCGACLFMISDSLLSIDRFAGDFNFSRILIWSTYFLAQTGITLGVLTEPPHHGRPMVA